MNTITEMLFWVSNSLLIPNIIVLLILFVRALILLGSFYNSFMTKRKTDSLLGDTAQLKLLEVEQTCASLHKGSSSLLLRYLHQLFETERISEEYVQYILSSFESDADREISTSRLLTKVGPILGLIGTLISMSPALVGLSSGDIEGMAYNMQIVFATTVVGLVISLIGLITQQYKQRWYAQDLARLEYLACQLIESKTAKDAQDETQA